jgi:hypothetical protein
VAFSDKYGNIYEEKEWLPPVQAVKVFDLYKCVVLWPTGKLEADYSGLAYSDIGNQELRTEF